LLVQIGVEVLRKLTKVHGSFAIEVNLPDNDSIFDIYDFFLNVLSVLEYSLFSILELIDSLLAITDILRDREGEPVVVLSSLIHPSIKLSDLLVKKAFLNRLQIAESLVVTSEELVQLVYMPHVVFLL